jgi:hypothetical protein
MSANVGAALLGLCLGSGLGLPMTPVPWAACCKQRRYGDRSPASYTSIRSMTFGESLPALLTRNALEAISVRSSPLPASVGYTVATRGYSFREGQPAGPVIEGRADSIDDLLNDRGSLDTP